MVTGDGVSRIDNAVFIACQNWVPLVAWSFGQYQLEFIWYGNNSFYTSIQLDNMDFFCRCHASYVFWHCNTFFINGIKTAGEELRFINCLLWWILYFSIDSNADDSYCKKFFGLTGFLEQVSLRFEQVKFFDCLRFAQSRVYVHLRALHARQQLTSCFSCSSQFF